MVFQRGIQDGGWAWVVSIASFFNLFIISGVSNSFGTLFVSLLNEFQQGESETAWIGSLAYGLTMLMGPIFTTFYDRFGARLMTSVGSLIGTIGLLSSSYVTTQPMLYLTFGIMWGLGASFIYFASLLVIGEYFSKHLSLANGICLAGSGAGTLVFSVAVSNLDRIYGWRVSMKFLCGTTALIAVSGLNFLPMRAPEDYKAMKNCVRETKERVVLVKKKVKMPSLYHNKAFLTWICAQALMMFFYYVPHVHLVSFAKQRGISPEQGSLFIGFMSMASSCGRVLFGKIADIPRVNRLYMYQAAILVTSVATTLLPLAKSFVAIFSFTIVAGFSDGCVAVLWAIITKDVVGRPLMMKAFGILNGAASIPLTLGPPVAGLILDQFGSYDPVFFIAGGLTILGGCLLFLIPPLMPEISSEVLLSEVKVNSSSDHNKFIEGDKHEDIEEDLPSILLQAPSLLYIPQDLGSSYFVPKKNDEENIVEKTMYHDGMIVPLLTNLYDLPTRHALQLLAQADVHGIPREIAPYPHMDDVADVDGSSESLDAFGSNLASTSENFSGSSETIIMGELDKLDQSKILIEDGLEKSSSLKTVCSVDSGISAEWEARPHSDTNLSIDSACDIGDDVIYSDVSGSKISSSDSFSQIKYSSDKTDTISQDSCFLELDDSTLATIIKNCDENFTSISDFSDVISTKNVTSPLSSVADIYKSRPTSASLSHSEVISLSSTSKSSRCSRHEMSPDEYSFDQSIEDLTGYENTSVYSSLSNLMYGGISLDDLLAATETDLVEDDEISFVQDQNETEQFIILTTTTNAEFLASQPEHSECISSEGECYLDSSNIINETKSPLTAQIAECELSSSDNTIQSTVPTLPGVNCTTRITDSNELHSSYDNTTCITESDEPSQSYDNSTSITDSNEPSASNSDGAGVPDAAQQLLSSVVTAYFELCFNSAENINNISAGTTPNTEDFSPCASEVPVSFSAYGQYERVM